jgi:hypothetical protein
MAQASHASNAFIHKYGKRPDVQEWTKSTKQGFGTAIVLSIDMLDLLPLVNELKQKKFPCDCVVDPEYGITISREIYNLIPSTTRSAPSVTKDDGKVVLFREETTCAYVFGSKEKLFQYVGNLPLYP